MKTIINLFKSIAMFLFKEHIDKMVTEMVNDIFDKKTRWEIQAQVKDNWNYTVTKINEATEMYKPLSIKIAETQIFIKDLDYKLTNHKFTIDDANNKLLKKALEEHDNYYSLQVDTFLKSKEVIKKLVEEINKYQVRK